MLQNEEGRRAASQEKLKAQVLNLYAYMEARERGSTYGLAHVDVGWPRRVLLPCGVVIVEV